MSSPIKQPVVEDIVSVFETTQNQSWSMFSDKLNNVSYKDSKKKDPAKSENTITLSSDDIPVFGLVPRLDKVMLVSCNECAMIVKRDCIHSHFYRRHNSSNVSHSEADKFSLVNFLCTVKPNKNKKLKMTVRKPEKKMNERGKVNTVVKEIKTEFDVEEYERLLKTNRAKIKQENTTEYGDRRDVDMGTTGCNPSTGSGVFDWDVKPCIKSLALDQSTDHKVNDKTIKHDKDSNKLLSLSFGNKKDDLQSNKYLDTQNIQRTVNYETRSSDLLTLDQTKKIKSKENKNISNCMIFEEKKYQKKHYTRRNKIKKPLHKTKNVKEETKLIIKNEYSEIVNNKNYKETSTFYNQSSNTSAADAKIENNKLFSGLPNDCEHEKHFSHYKHLDVKSEMPIDSATDYNQPTESPKIKEEFKIISNNMYPDVKIKEEFKIISNNMYPDVKIKEEFKIISNNMYPDVKIKEEFKIISNNMYPDVKIKEEFKIISNNVYPDVKIKEEFKIISNNMYPDVKIKEEYDENNDKSKVEFYQPPTKLTKYSSANNHSEVISNTYSGNVGSNLSLIAPCNVVDIKEETTFTESIENIMNSGSSDDTVISNNQSSIALLNIKEESKYLLTTDYINEVSKPSLITVHPKEESKSSLNTDFINEKSKYPLFTSYISDKSYSEFYQLCEDSVLSPSYKYLGDELNFQDENKLSSEINLQIEETSNNLLNLQVENDLKVKEGLNNELNFPSENHLSDELNLQSEDSLSDELNLPVKEDLNNKINFEGEESLIDEIDLPAEDDLSDGINWQSVEDLFDELNFQGGEDLNAELNLRGEDESSIEVDYQDEDDLSDELNLQSEDDLADELNFQGEEDLNVELNLQSEDNLSDVENVSNEEDLSDEEDLNDEENFSGKENLSSDDIENDDNLKYDSLIPSQIPNNEGEIKHIPSKECSVIVNNESSNVAFTGHDQSFLETLNNKVEPKAKFKIDDAYVMTGNDCIVKNFENEYYQLYYQEVQTSFTPSYKYSDVISNDNSDNSSESLSSYDQSSVESLDVSEKTDYSSTDTSDYTSNKSLDECTTCSTSSSDQSTVLDDITKKPKCTQTNLLEKHEQFMGNIAMLTKSFDHVDGKNNCTQTDVPLECMNCYDSTDDYVDCHSAQIDENSAPINCNGQIDEYGVNNFTPINSSAQIINNKIIHMDVEEYELQDGNDSDFNISNKSHYSSHFHPHPCNPASKNNNLMHNPINENNCKIFNDELDAYKPNEYVTINEAIPFIDTNNEICKELIKMVDKKSVNDKKCKIIPFAKIAKNYKKNLKRQVADNKENRHHLITRGVKKFKIEFIERDFLCSDESNNNDNVDD